MLLLEAEREQKTMSLTFFSAGMQRTLPKVGVFTKSGTFDGDIVLGRAFFEIPLNEIKGRIKITFKMTLVMFNQSGLG